MAASSSQAGYSRPLVFINYRKAELRETFILHLLRSLNTSKVNYFIDDKMDRGKPISFLFTKIEESRIALAIFSKRYPESEWCLDELQKIKELVEADILKVIPVFVNVTTSNVKNFNGEFGKKFKETRERYAGKPEKVKKWKEAVEYIAGISGVVWDNREY